MFCYLASYLSPRNNCCAQGDRTIVQRIFTPGELTFLQTHFRNFSRPIDNPQDEDKFATAVAEWTSGKDVIESGASYHPINLHVLSFSDFTSNDISTGSDFTTPSFGKATGTVRKFSFHWTKVQRKMAVDSIEVRSCVLITEKDGNQSFHSRSRRFYRSKDEWIECANLFEKL